MGTDSHLWASNVIESARATPSSRCASSGASTAAPPHAASAWHHRCSLAQISASVLTNRQLVQKVYFPRLILPLSGLLVPAVDFMFSCVVLAGIMAWFHVGTSTHILLAPVFLLLLATTALGVGSVFAAINVRYRDVPYVVPFIIQIWLWLSPVAYPTAALPQKYQLLSSINPVAPAITGFRWAVGGTPPPTGPELLIGVGSAAMLLTVGFSVYRRWELRFADTI